MTGPLGYRRFRALFAGRAISMLGSAIAPVAIAFAILDLTGSAAALGLVLAARSIPEVVFMLVGGVIADRFDRARILVAANIVAGVAQGVAATMLLTGTASIPALAALEAINGMASAIVFPAAAAMTPLTVPSALLQQANAMLRLGLNAALIVGAASGGLLVGTVGSGWGLAVDAAAYTVAAGCFVRLGQALDADPGASHRKPGSVNIVADLREGWREVISRTWLWTVVVAFGFANAAQAAARSTLGPVVADRSFGPEGWGLVLAAQTAGMFAGGFLMLRLRPARLLLVGCAAILLWVPMFVVLAVSPTLTVLLPVAFVGGIGIEVFSVCWDLSLQQQVSQDRLSRVYAFDALGSYAMIPIGQLAAGPLALALGTEDAIMACAVVVAVSIGATLAVPSVRHLRRTDVLAATT
jgi:predicted MFS family arabinose efflux permease